MDRSNDRLLRNLVAIDEKPMTNTRNRVPPYIPSNK
jgi:hypothetical protein